MAAGLALALVSSGVAGDARLKPPTTLNTLRSFPEIGGKAAWEARAAEIRTRALASCGLLPMPEKTPLDAKIFGRVEREGYSVEEVVLQTMPGFYLVGNLYRPLGQGDGPFPAMLNPHGHWSNGRLVDNADGSIAARCVNFAKRGIVAFAYDMVGYNDTRQVKHTFAQAPENQLDSINLMGLQTWNSIRALDFLEALPGVDAKRLSCTGESGGGTQTFMLGVVDSRLQSQAPIVMVSHSMQGGCLCENAPLLRVDHSNMEYSAAAAPRPQMLVAATGDWTSKTMEVEGPAIASVYKLLGAPGSFRHAIFDFPHNYNKTSREAVYAWANEWLLGAARADKSEELPYLKEPDAELLAWDGKDLPPDALNEAALTAAWRARNQRRLEADRRGAARNPAAFDAIYRPLWRHSLLVAEPSADALAEHFDSVKSDNGRKVERVTLGRKGVGDQLPLWMVSPAQGQPEFVVVLVGPEGKSAVMDGDGNLTPRAGRILGAGGAVVGADLFLTGELADAGVSAQRDHFKNYFTTHNRTDLQERAQDIATVVAYARARHKGAKVALWASAGSASWALLAAPAAEWQVVDAAGFDESDAAQLLDRANFVPGYRKLGGVATALTLAREGAFLVFNAKSSLNLAPAKAVFAAAGKSRNLDARAVAVADEEVVDWLRWSRHALR